MTSETITGGCRCGAVRYMIAAEPIFMNHCQCMDCQHLSGTGHSSYLTFPKHAVEQTGEPRIYQIVGDSGNAKYHGACPDCGSPVSLSFAGMPKIFVVHASSLDDPRRFRPTAITYSSRAQPWDQFDSSLRRFATTPSI